jgi:plastocyanin
LTSGESTTLINDAAKAIEAAQKMCQKGQLGTFSLGTKARNVKMGTPATKTQNLECTNFMSPKDCKILFNVCDPVICPISRCDYGGKFPVKDVIGSGIIGSLVLCLPNFVGWQGEVYIPICLSGILAGMDSLISVFKGYRDCLQNSLDTGELTGSCDQINSFYICKMVWDQALPFAKMIIPKTIELVMGKATRGGGEYLSVQDAWSTAAKSVDSFAQYYAADSYAAFKSKIVQSMSEEVCGLYISGAYPDGENILDTLTNPKSPPQYYGQFEETTYTTATNPSISHYKVFYHIYAGKDSRAYYQVYLTEGPTSSYYQDTSNNYIVATGYIEKGGYESQTPDFTAVSGYKKLCITVNGKTDCGFGKSSSSFAIDYVSDQYVKDQANRTDITSESECVSGSSSAWSLATTSLQGAISEVANPELYNRGIIRVCAAENPGSGKDTSDTNLRWISVGYCGKKELKCWLDTQSVKNAVNFESTANETITSLTDSFIKQMIAEGKYLTEDQFKEKIKEIGLKEDSAQKIALINTILKTVSMNAQKGLLYLLRGDEYGTMARDKYKAEQEEKAKKEAEAAELAKQEAEKKAAEKTIASQKCTDYSTAISKHAEIQSTLSGSDKDQANLEFITDIFTNNLITQDEYGEFVNEEKTGDGYISDTTMSGVLSILNSYKITSCAGTTVDTEKIAKCAAYSTAISKHEEIQSTLSSSDKDQANLEFITDLFTKDLITQDEYSGFVNEEKTGNGYISDTTMNGVLSTLNSYKTISCAGTTSTSKAILGEICIFGNTLIKKYFDAINKKEVFAMDTRYSQAEVNKKFVEDLKSNNLLTDEEYNTIIGPINQYVSETILNVIGGSPLGTGEKDMEYVFNLLNKKYNALCGNSLNEKPTSEEIPDSGFVLTSYPQGSSEPTITIRLLEAEKSIELKVTNPSSNYVKYAIGYKRWGWVPIVSYDSAGEIVTKNAGGIFSIKIPLSEFHTSQKYYYAEIWFFDKNNKEIEDSVKLGPFAMDSSSIEPITTEKTCADYKTAIEEFLKLDQDSKYSEHKDMVDALSTSGFITEEDYNALKGEEYWGFGFEKDMRNVVSVLRTRSSEACDLSQLCANDRFKNLVVSLGKTNTIVYNGKSCSCGQNCENHANEIIKVSTSYSIDPLLLLSLMIQESGCNPNKVGSSGEIGLMQIIPRFFCGDFNLDSDIDKCKKQLEDYQINIDVGAQILSKYYKESHNGITDCGTNYADWNAAVRKYNGLNKCNSYVENVNQIHQSLGALCKKESSSYSTTPQLSPIITPTLDELRSAVLTSVSKFDGTIIEKKYSVNCFTAIQAVYSDASRGLSKCVYSPTYGTRYSIVDTSGNSQEVTLGEGTFATAINCYYSSSSTNYDEALKKILPGDIINFVFNREFGHSVIFINWMEGKEYQVARVFDWRGEIKLGEKDSKGNICEYSTCKTYSYNNYDFSIDKHPVYRIWNPVKI